MRIKPFLAALLVLALTSCSAPSPDDSLVVYAAASLQDVIREVNEEFAANTSAQFDVNYNSSGLLARQIASGAPAGVFISANVKWVEFLSGQNLTGTVVSFCSNSLVLAVSESSTVELQSLEGLPQAELESLAIGDPAHVPAGIYASQALKSAGLWNALESRMIYAVNVRAALKYVTDGAADAAIVYASDVYGMEGIRAIAIDESLHDPIVYQAAIIGDSTPAASAYITFLTSDSSRLLLRNHGFKP